MTVSIDEAERIMTADPSELDVCALRVRQAFERAVVRHEGGYTAIRFVSGNRMGSAEWRVYDGNLTPAGLIVAYGRTTPRAVIRPHYAPDGRRWAVEYAGRALRFGTFPEAEQALFDVMERGLL